MKKLFLGTAVLIVMVIAMALVGQADQTITITKPVIISGTTYTTGNVTVDDNTARLLVKDGKATYVSAPASKNKPTFSTDTLSATTGNITTINGTTVTATTINGTTGTITNVSSSGTITGGTVAATTLNATTGTITNVSTSGTATVGTGVFTTLTATTSTVTGTLTSANLVVTAGTTKTCASGLASITIASGIVTAATCTP